MQAEVSSVWLLNFLQVRLLNFLQAGRPCVRAGIPVSLALSFSGSVLLSFFSKVHLSSHASIGSMFLIVK